MRKLFVLGILALLALPAMAADYPKAEVFGGYQYTRLEGGLNANGFNFAVTGNFSDWFGITGDIGAGYKTQDGVSFNNYTYTFGPVISLRANKGWTPFAHALIGGDHASAGIGGVSASSNGYAIMAGGGLDLNFSPRLAFRAVQADWLLLHNDGGTSSKNARISTGVVLKF